MITLINGFPQNPSALIVPNGSIRFELNVDATVVAAPGGFVCADQPIVFQFDSTGHIQPNSPATAAQIYSNAELNPQNGVGLGTYYLVTFYDANGAQLNKVPMWWQFTEASGATVDISQMTPFLQVGGNVIFYPVSFTIPAPTPSTLGGVFSNVGASHQWISAINTNGSVTLSQPSFADISGTLSPSQLPSPLTFGAITATGLITAQANIQLGVVGVTGGQITFEGATSGSSTITAPAVAGTAANPFSFSNGINIPSGTAFSINTDTGISRDSAGVLDIGNGTPGNTSGSIKCAAITASGLITAQANIQLGVAGTTSGVVTMEGSTSGAVTITAPAIGGVITNPILLSNSLEIPSGTVYQISTDTGISRDSAGVIDIGNGTNGNKSGTVNAATFTATTSFAMGTVFNVSSAGLISKYNNIPTVKGGIPIMVADSLLTGQVAAITATTIYAIPAAQAGLYRITYVATITTASGTSSSLGGTNGFQVKFTNANGDSVVKTSNPTTPTVSAGNTTATTISGVVTGYAAASTNLQYLFDYTGGSGPAMAYDLAIYVEYLG